MDLFEVSKTEEMGAETIRIVLNLPEVGLTNLNDLSTLINGEVSSNKSFAIDFKNVNAINSSGLGILIACLKKIKDSGGKLTLENLNNKILNIFKITKLDLIFDIK
ncbi:hypothetical protein BH10BAC5_BH10BAC5_06220 [soil metagenome]